MKTATATATPSKEKKRNPKALLWALGCIIAIILGGRFMQSGKSLSQLWGEGHTRSYPSVTLTKNIWSQRVEIPPGKIFSVISITPLVKRVVMVNGDPNRVYSLPASVSNDVNLGTNVRFLQWMIDPSEPYASAVLEYTLR